MYINRTGSLPIIVVVPSCYSSVAVMKFETTDILSIALAGLVFFDGVVAASTADSGSKRRDIKPYPKQPKTPHYVSAARTKTCTVTGGKTDDAPAILAAAKKCNDGGTVVFPKSSTYNVGTALDLTFLKHVDLDIQGTIKACNTIMSH